MQHWRIAVLALAIGVWCVAENFAASARHTRGGNHAAGQSFRECKAFCPEMVVIRPGIFTIGGPPGEVGRGTDESPQKLVTIQYALAVGKYPVTRGEFSAFVHDSGRKVGPCEHWDGKPFRVQEGIYRSNAFHQTDRHPVVA